MYQFIISEAHVYQDCLEHLCDTVDVVFRDNPSDCYLAMVLIYFGINIYLLFKSTYNHQDYQSASDI